MIMGGGAQDEGEATARVSFVNLTATNPQYAPLRPMEFDGISCKRRPCPIAPVLATGGGGTREASQGGTINPQFVRRTARRRDLDPAAGPQGAWRKVAPAQVARLYHSVALLPARWPGGRGGKTNPPRVRKCPGCPPTRFEEERLEMYYPPYLFQKGKPARLSAVRPRKSATAQGPISTAQASSIGSVNLGVSTRIDHTFLQRRTALGGVPFTVVANFLQATVPNAPNAYSHFRVGTCCS